jgi:hypothetical protein
MNELDNLAIKYNTDKSSLFHDYTKIYDFVFKDLRKEKYKLLEIGVLDGASLKMWGEYFDESLIIGMDIDEKCKLFENNKVQIEIGNQTDLTFLDDLIKKYQKFDIILDDGGHTWFQQKTTFIHLFKSVAEGGFYVIEDLSTSYLKGSVWDTGGENTTNFLKKLVDDFNLNGKSIVGVKEIQNKDINYFEASIEYILFFKGTCIIKKRNHYLK